METLREIFDPNFLLRNSVYIGLLIGFVCPLIGVYLVIRRLIFMGVALPQVSSCGIAFAFALHSWQLIPHLEESSEHGLALAGAGLFTLATLVILSLMDRRQRGSTEGRIGTVYVLAGAWSILLLLKNPFGEHGLLERLQGKIIAVSNFDLGLTAIIFAAVVLCLIFFQKELLLVSYDREMALSLGKNIYVWDGLLFVIIGLSISLAVLSVGPAVTFGFLILPPLIVRNFVRTMRQFCVAASLLGGISSVIGFWIAYKYDLPVGPTDIALLGVIYAVVFVFRKSAELIRPRAI
ncbi:MAG TPA: metal ABC transporter permease [Candidatus Kapabacteria bacterium]|nr:metal ABC transporter permease [Candidatus Kapabacteria bacterium]